MTVIFNNTEINNAQDLSYKIQAAKYNIDRILNIISRAKVIPERECLVSFMFNKEGFSRNIPLSSLEDGIRQMFNRISELKIPYVHENVEHFETASNPIWDIREAIENSENVEENFVIKGSEIRYIIPKNKEELTKRSKHFSINWCHLKDDFEIIIYPLQITKESQQKAIEKQFLDIKEALISAKLVDNNGKLII